MPGHSPMLAMLKDGPILIRQPEGGDLHAAVHTGFAVVDAGKVIILAESAELPTRLMSNRPKICLRKLRQAMRVQARSLLSLQLNRASRL